MPNKSFAGCHDQKRSGLAISVIVAFAAFSGLAQAQETPPAPELSISVPEMGTPIIEPSAMDTPSVDGELTDQIPNDTVSAQTETLGEAQLADSASDTPEVPAPSPSEDVFDALRTVLPEALHDESLVAQGASDRAAKFLREGGPSIWAIAFLSVVTVALILWKIWRLALIGAWSKGKARKSVQALETGDVTTAQSLVQGRRGLRSKVVSSALSAKQNMTDDDAREETTRVAKHELAEAAVGLRALELIATIAPLLGLLGTVLGMIAAFQALQESGSRADPSMLAGGIWEALLTTAAGMAVAIPASAALTWFEAVIDRMRRDVEDAAVRIFLSYPAPQPEALAAE